MNFCAWDGCIDANIVYWEQQKCLENVKTALLMDV